MVFQNDGLGSISNKKQRGFMSLKKTQNETVENHRFMLIVGMFSMNCVSEEGSNLKKMVFSRDAITTFTSMVKGKSLNYILQYREFGIGLWKYHNCCRKHWIYLAVCDLELQSRNASHAQTSY